MNSEIRKLQNHFNNGMKEGYQAKIYYSIGDRVHLKGTNINGVIIGVIIGVIFKEDRSYPYLKIKWDSECENVKKFYDPFDVVKEIKLKPRHKKEKKVYENFYLKERKKING